MEKTIPPPKSLAIVRFINENCALASRFFSFFFFFSRRETSGNTKQSIFVTREEKRKILPLPSKLPYRPLDRDKTARPAKMNPVPKVIPRTSDFVTGWDSFYKNTDESNWS